ncbi:MAG: tetratricopeptide repeat protein [Candidatus Rokubacteria bacterium]|nr:tetratricopeptide repeat protein [Candidatus Rokubacteria bacterium]
MNLSEWRPAPRTLVAAGLGIVAVLLVAGGLWFWLGARAERGQAVHADALAQAQAARNPQAPATAKSAAITTLEAALAQAPDAALAAQAAYELGSLRFDLGQFAPARAAWEIALARAGSATVRTMARAGIAAAWESERNFPKAIDAYAAALAAEKDGPFYREDLLIGLGRSQELAGKRDDAIKTYERVLKEVPKLRRADEVRGRLASLASSR